MLLAIASCEQREKDMVARWSFEGPQEQMGKESVSKNVFAIHSDVHTIESVKGVKGEAIRLDGYSTWAKGAVDIDKKLRAFTVSSWFALESYPVDIASIISAYDSARQVGFKLSVNEYGYPVVALDHKGNKAIIQGKQPLPKIKWHYLTATVDQNQVNLFNNGELITQGTHDLSGYSFPKEGDIYIGKGYQENKVAETFPTNTINGIVDEVKIFDQKLAEKKIKTTYGKLKPEKKPNLTIPSTRFAGDFHRPEYHPIPPAAWTNETHGLIYHDDKYHIYYQKNATGPYWAHINWGHMSTPDLLQWDHHKPVLWPEKGYDEFGIWSGHVIKNEEGTPVIMYTAGDGEKFGMAMAYPQNDKLTEWKKYEKNPVIPEAPEKFERSDMRDPYIWKEKDTYYMIIGFGVEKPKKAGAVLLYKSMDLKNWEYLNLMHVGKPEVFPCGVFWEMPVFWKFKNKDKYVLLVNKIPYKGDPARAFYWVGEFKNERFVPDHEIPKLLEVVNGLLSPSVAYDKQKRTTAIAIIPDEIKPQGNYELGWAHLYSIPREWKLEDNRIKQYPHPNLKRLRTGHQSYQNIDLTPGTDNRPNIDGRQLELVAEFSQGSARDVGIILGKHPDDKEFTKISYDFALGKFTVDRTKSSLNKYMHSDVKSGKLPEPKNGKIKMHVFVDGSVVEVFVNDGYAFTTRMFPEKKVSNNVEFFSEGGKATLESLDVWKMDIKQVK